VNHGDIGESTIKHWQPREGTKEEDPEKIRGLMQQRHAFWGGFLMKQNIGFVLLKSSDRRPTAGHK